METPFKIQQISANFNETSSIDERVFYLLFEPEKLECGSHLLDRLLTFERETRKMFRNLLEKAFKGHSNEDQACLVIYHPDMKEDIIVTLREIDTITEETLLDHLEEEDLDATKPFKIKFTILCNCNE